MAWVIVIGTMVLFAPGVFFLVRGLVRQRKKGAADLKRAMEAYDRKLNEDRKLCGRIHELDWHQLLELQKRHGKKYEPETDEISDVDWHICSGVPGHKHGYICWLEIVRKEIVKRVEALLSANDLKGLQDLAAAYDFDQAWEAIGKTDEGVAWLEAGCHSRLPKLRARCFQTLRGE